jgi:hypothetical protein
MKRYQSWIISFSIPFVYTYFEMGYQLWGMDGIWYNLMRVVVIIVACIAVHEGLSYLLNKLTSKPQETVRIELDEPLKGRSRHD